MADATVRAEWIESGAPVLYRTPGGGIVKMLHAFKAELVNGTATVDMLAPSTGFGFQIDDFKNFGAWAKLAGTTPNVTLRLLQSWDDAEADYVVPETGGSPITITDTTAHVVSVAPTAMRWLRLRLVGNAGNGTNVTAAVYLYCMGAGL